MEPHITFIISLSNVPTLTAGFFGSTNFDSRVREIKGINNTWNTIESNSFKYYAKSISIDISGNEITTINNDAFRNFASLLYLNISNNKIQNLYPKSLYTTPDSALSVLDLSNNLLVEINSGVFNHLPPLENLNLSYNSIEVLESNCFNQATNLKVLDLSYNKIISIIDENMFRNNIHLQYFNISNNQVTKIEDGCFKKCDLKHVNFENNSISGDITNATFLGLNFITELNLYHQNITSLKANAFSCMDMLVYLNISHNSITSIDKDSFQHITSLRVLDLSYNKITNLYFLNNTLNNLTHLNLNNNKIVSLQKGLFDNQKEIIKLDLSMNEIIEYKRVKLSVDLVLGIKPGSSFRRFGIGLEKPPD
ncbi:leucine-rich repeat-containing protein 15-like [Battus philenor]|uniref:leucine-rich repeat-containing protein 15-like n=1 Tax=Battus philenor TaxID=42288 RepID=UPI0035CFB8D2